MAQDGIKDRIEGDTKDATKRSSIRFSELVSAAVARLDVRRSRALVPLPQEEPSHELDQFSGLGATFLAHLIATRDRAPQTLRQYRGTTDEAISSYEHAAPHDDDTIPIKES
jgi:hypothetical protein